MWAIEADIVMTHHDSSHYTHGLVVCRQAVLYGPTSEADINVSLVHRYINLTKTSLRKCNCRHPSTKWRETLTSMHTHTRTRTHTNSHFPLVKKSVAAGYSKPRVSWPEDTNNRVKGRGCWMGADVTTNTRMVDIHIYQRGFWWMSNVQASAK